MRPINSIFLIPELMHCVVNYEGNSISQVEFVNIFQTLEKFALQENKKVTELSIEKSLLVINNKEYLTAKIF